MPCLPALCCCWPRRPPAARRRAAFAETADNDGDSSDEEKQRQRENWRKAVRQGSGLQRRYTDASAFGEGDVFDDIAAEFWPALRGFIEDHVLLGIVEPSLKKLIWSRTRFTRCSLGKRPPRVWGSKSHRIEKSHERTVELAMDVDFGGEDVDIEVLVDHGLKATISKVSIRGTFCIEMRNFLRELPLLTGMTLYFMNPPDVSITFGGLLGPVETRIMSVSKIIEKQLAANLVVPNRLTLHLAPHALSYDEVRYPPPKGILDVQLHGAARLRMPTGGWTSTKQLAQVELRLGAEQIHSPPRLVDKSGTASWQMSWSSFVDYPHGQTLMVEVRPVASRMFQARDATLGHAKMSVAQVSAATAHGQTDWPLDECEGPEATLGLSGVYRPLVSGSSLSEGRGLEPLADGTRGVVMVVLDSVRDLGAALDGHHVECLVSVGEHHVETRRVLSHRLTPADMGPKMEDKLRLLLGGNPGSSGAAFGLSGEGAQYSPEAVAWLLGMDRDPTAKIAAIARQSVEAEFKQPLRLRVQDPMKDSLVIELQRGRSRKVTVARFTLRLQDLLTQKNWTLPMTERAFTTIPEELHNRPFPPKFVARVQFLAAGPPETIGAQNDLVSRRPSGGRRTANSQQGTPVPSCAVERRRQTMRFYGQEERSDSSGDEASPAMEERDPPLVAPCCTWPMGALLGHHPGSLQGVEAGPAAPLPGSSRHSSSRVNGNAGGRRPTAAEASVARRNSELSNGAPAGSRNDNHPRGGGIGFLDDFPNSGNSFRR
eukprot:TRINITY_DN18578_c0_g2_i1.p1 TRINITY_DN18578_c0_g2~~TRINITY_DN18578_c0_g2_i1.p1  ORF type:complete len:769 (-),score=126.22 TRINITY_DN18578_c0_g2_i1:93-2399(-)